MNIRTSYRHTLYASYLGYVTQAVVNNFVPLLLLTFQSTWGISLSRLATLVSVNFGIQLLVDLAGARFVVPLRRLDEAEGTAPMTIRQLLCRPVFWLFVVLMLCAGASEQAMSQWSSAFAEQGLSTFGSLSAATRKTLSDLAGPCLFALLMGTARVVSARLSHRHDMRRMMLVC